MEASQQIQNDTGNQVAEFSREVVKLYARAYGRGPTKARTYMQNDFAVVLLEEIMTPAEHTLIDAGEEERVADTRLAFQEAVREQFNEIAERITGRKVKAFFSQVHLATDMAAEMFVFEPVAEPDPGSQNDSEPKNRR